MSGTAFELVPTGAGLWRLRACTGSFVALDRSSRLVASVGSDGSRPPQCFVDILTANGRVANGAAVPFGTPVALKVAGRARPTSTSAVPEAGAG